MVIAFSTVAAVSGRGRGWLQQSGPMPIAIFVIVGVLITTVIEVLATSGRWLEGRDPTLPTCRFCGRQRRPGPTMDHPAPGGRPAHAASVAIVMMLDPMYRGPEPGIHSFRSEARLSQIDQLFTEGDALYEAMLASIDSANTVVRMESYIFASDEVGWRFAQALVVRRCGRRCPGASGRGRCLGQHVVSLQRYLRDHGAHP